MGEKTGIQWCDHTFNPWIGCTKVSAGCRNCYAEIDNPARIARGQGLELWGVDAARKPKADSGWREPEKWFRKAVRDGVRRRVFCASQCDVFEDRRDLDVHRERLWGIIERTGVGWGGLIQQPEIGGLDWLLLTKRPEAILRLIPERWRAGLPPNVWVGTSVEDQAAADERVPHLLRVPARVRFLSCEPLLGPVHLNPPVCPDCGGREAIAGFDGTPFCERCECEMGYGGWLSRYADEDHAGISWVIIGGESGRQARPCDVAWVRDLVAQCRAAGVAPFVKQLGANPHQSGDDAHRFGSIATLCDSHGGDPSEWAEDLRVREFPV